MRRLRIQTKVIILSGICLLVLIGAIIADNRFGKSYLVKIDYKRVVEKLDNKDTFVLLISKTDCSHCMNYKPKLASVAKKYKINVYYIEFDTFSEDDKTQFSKYFSFDGTPQTVFVIDGSEKTAASRINGDTSTEKIISKFKSNGFID